MSFNTLIAGFSLMRRNIFSLWRLSAVLSWLLLVLAVPATANTDQRGSQDHPLFERYPLSWIVDYRREIKPEYMLATGPMLKVNGRVQVESEERLRGQLWQITYQLPAEHHPREAFAFMREQLAGYEAEVLFQCRARACGDSAYWANQVFRKANLYGLDREQDYLAARFSQNGNDIYVALYSVLRGNKRAFLHLEVMHAGRTGVSEGPLRRQVPVAFSSDDQLVTPALPQEWLAPLRNGQWRQLWILSHLGGAEEPAVLLERGRNRAEQLKRLLRDQGIVDIPIEVWPLGNFAGAKAAEAYLELWAYPQE